MFRIKVCGIRSRADEQNAFRCGADAVGLNFCQTSRRYLDQAARGDFVHRPPTGLLRIGVFAGESPQAIQQIARECHLDAIQLHGDEPAEDVIELQPLPVIKAFRSDPTCHRTVSSFLDECRRSRCSVAAVLIDAASSGSFGGSGRVANWTVASQLGSLLGGLPLILAGGLTSENVMRAIAIVRPFGVDVASGVERNGQKDPDLMRRFVELAKPPLLAGFSS